SSAITSTTPSRARSAEVLVGEVPVHELPELLDVLGTRVPIVDVVRVLPDVDRQDADLAGRERGVRVRGGLDREAAVAGLDQPRPAAAELAGRRLRELVLEVGEAAERLVDRRLDRAGRLA